MLMPLRKATQAAAAPPAGTAGLPRMPKIFGLKPRKKYLPWSHAADRLASSRNYWICTVRPDGRPHSIPVWGLWVDDTLYFGTAHSSCKARNLARNAAVSVHLESGDDVVIIEGTAVEVSDRAALSKLDRPRQPYEIQNAASAHSRGERDLSRAGPHGIGLAGKGSPRNSHEMGVCLMSRTHQPLLGRIALVAGATRGAGRGIACALGEAGATVYCTGRSVRGKPATKGRHETINETAEMVTAHGGKGIAVRCDHTKEGEVKKLVARIQREQKGRLDILVNDVWGGDTLTEFGKTFWQVSLDKGLKMLEQAVHSHIITSRHVGPLIVNRGSGLIVEITDGDSFGYRGNLFYDLVKMSVIRLAMIMAYELRKTKITAVAVTPGFLRSEAMLDRFGVTEVNWRDAGKKRPDFLHSETPLYVGRAIAALAADPEVKKKSGKVFSSWELSDEYGFSDADGTRPHWGRHFAEKYGTAKKFDETLYGYFWESPMSLVFPDWP